MTEAPSETRAAFVTFYSCKGGVGRSMALINVAGILAGRGFRVLALDMDLEAPGISYLMQHEAGRPPATSLGFVDLLTDACVRGEAGDMFALDPVSVVERYSYVYNVPEALRKADEGVLRIMPAGQLDDDYQARLDALDLGRLYRDGHGQPLIAAFKQVLQEANLFDFVFVDSRTGFSDEAGICTRDLADHLIIVMGLNRQNVDGTAAFLRTLQRAGVTTAFRVALSPVPNGEDELVEERERIARDVLSANYGKPVDVSLQIPYHPRLALTEEPHIFRRSKGYLYDAYARIEAAVVAMAGHSAGALVAAIEQAATEKRFEAVIDGLRRLRKLDYGHLAEGLAYGPISGFLLDESAGVVRAELLRSLEPGSRVVRSLASRLHDAGLADAALFYEHGLRVDQPSAFLLGNYAVFQTHFQRNHAAAEELYERAIAAEPNHANNLGNYAGMLFILRRTSEALELLTRAWAADSLSDPLRCELHFYAVAHAWRERPESLAALKDLLASGARSPDWPLAEHVRVATEDGHPAPEFLAALACVISEGAAIETLDAYPLWLEGVLVTSPA